MSEMSEISIKSTLKYENEEKDEKDEKLENRMCTEPKDILNVISKAIVQKLRHEKKIIMQNSRTLWLLM